MSNKVLLKKSSVVAKVPQTSDLDYGELALNYADGKLYFKNSSNAINSFSANIDLSAYATLTGSQTLTNKTISLGSNTISGTLAQLNTAITDADVASLAGAETLTNKTLASPVITGTLTANGGVGLSGQVLKSTGTGVQWASPSGGALSNLSDVSINSPQAQQVLKYNGTQWINAANDVAVASAVFAAQAQSDLGSVTDLIIGTTEDLGLVNELAYFIYDMGQLRLDGIVSLNNLDQSVKADYTSMAIIFGF
jgi:hypothetical protein